MTMCNQVYRFFDEAAASDIGISHGEILGGSSSYGASSSSVATLCFVLYSVSGGLTRAGGPWNRSTDE
ncbi:unnamed protein product [Alternaria burnsii]|nr:unnamed protein product [Alternaria burnsii]